MIDRLVEIVERAEVEALPILAGAAAVLAVAVLVAQFVMAVS